MDCPLGIRVLPTECLDLIVCCLQFTELKSLSCVNKTFREICSRYLFRCVKFTFSLSSLRDMGDLAETTIRKHVVYLTYEVPDLLKEDILNIDSFNELCPHSDYIDESHELFALDLDPPPPYMMIYESLVAICKEQRQLINQSLDQSTLTATIRRLRNLKAVNLAFKSAAPQWLRPLLYRGLILEYEGSFHHHLDVVLNAMNATKNYSVKFKGLQLSRSFLRRYPNFSHISNSIPYIIQPIDVIRYERAGMILQALANDSPETSSCDTWISRSAFEIFLAYHTDSSIPVAENAVFRSMLQNTVQHNGDCTFNIWEPGWVLQVQTHRLTADS